ncbi:hypothetical protein NIES4072_22930 [Nostoc commune NIES-4072]|uniref:Uncharacterized protein n=1 Tax=Nostoc commune NIES-4072 TaxID=2005467 RepID=A0A2R5FME6_NOSCO|nr:hypothetical protein [Nostoc commune]BBD64045.1 hypothetical protein NIES4070_03870 [Nostoc commune HK-02]GBG18628.1 hypothetical protein NIES4072_22930 [Nostoc commune NIES-4072]
MVLGEGEGDNTEFFPLPPSPFPWTLQKNAFGVEGTDFTETTSEQLGRLQAMR